MQFTQLSLPVILIAVMVVTPSCSPHRAAMQTSKPTAQEATIAREVHRTINNYRASQGLTRLPRHTGLERLAQGHSDYLRGKQGTFSLHGKNISHFKFKWRAQQAATHYGFSKTSENLASIKMKPDGQAHHLLILWVASEGHRENIHGDWTHSGVGTAITKDGQIIATQLFAAKVE